MKWLKNPMINAIYMVTITAICAAIFIVSSEFVVYYSVLLSDSWWASVISSKSMKFVGIGMIGIAIIIDTLSALRRKKFDEYQIIALEKIMLFNGIFMAILSPLFSICACFCANAFCGNSFFFNSISMGSYSNYKGSCLRTIKFNR